MSRGPSDNGDTPGVKNKTLAMHGIEQSIIGLVRVVKWGALLQFIIMVICTLNACLL